MTRAEIAQARLKAASEHVEAAQHELERAISALGALAWMSGEQTKLGVLRDRIHEAFYRLSPISHARSKACAKAELDREVEPGDEDRHKGCCDSVTRARFSLADRTPKVAIGPMVVLS